MIDSTSVSEVAVKVKVLLSHTAGFGVPDPDVKVPDERMKREYAARRKGDEERT